MYLNILLEVTINKQKKVVSSTISKHYYFVFLLHINFSKILLLKLGLRTPYHCSDAKTYVWHQLIKDTCAFMIQYSLNQPYCSIQCWTYMSCNTNNNLIIEFLVIPHISLTTRNWKFSSLKYSTFNQLRIKKKKHKSFGLYYMFCFLLAQTK